MISTDEWRSIGIIGINCRKVSLFIRLSLSNSNMIYSEEFPGVGRRLGTRQEELEEERRDWFTHDHNQVTLRDIDAENYNH